MSFNFPILFLCSSLYFAKVGLGVFFPTIGIRVGGSLATKMSTMKFDIEKFDGRINFGLWQVQGKSRIY